MIPAVAVVAVLLVASCERPTTVQAPTRRSAELSFILSERDTPAFAAAVEKKPHDIRKQLIELLTQSLKRRAAGEDILSSPDVADLSWAAGQYSASTGISDIRWRLDLLCRLTVSEARTKVCADSLLAEGNSLFDELKETNPAGASRKFLAALNETDSLYRTLGDDIGLAAAARYRAVAYLAVDSIKLARQAVDQAVALARQRDIPDLLGDCHLLLYQIAGAHEGNLLEAEGTLADARRAYARTEQESRLTLPVASQAAYLRGVNRPSQALEVLAEALALSRQHGQSRLEGYCHHLMAECYYDLDCLDSALACNDEAIRIRIGYALERQSSSSLVDWAHTLSTRALILHSAGQNGCAQDLYKSAESLFRRAGDKSGEWLNSGRWAALLFETGRVVEADSMFRSVLLGSPTLETRLAALFGVGACACAQGRIDEGRQYLRECVYIAEQLRNSLPTPELRTGLLSDKAGFYHLLAATYLSEYSKGDREAALDSALAYLSRIQARSLVEALAEQPLRSCPDEERLLEEVSNLRVRLLFGSPDSTRLAHSLRRLEDSLDLARPACHPPEEPEAADRSAEQGMTTARLQSSLAQGDMVVGWVFARSYGNFAYAFSPDTVIVRLLTLDVEQLHRMADSFVVWARTYPTAGSLSGDDRPTLAGVLFGGLFGSPQMLVNRHRLIIVASGLAARLPFSALVAPDGRYLIEKLDISYVPSISFIPTSFESPDDVRFERILVFGDPQPQDSTRYSELPYSALEVGRVAAAFPGATLTAVGNAATEERLRTAVEDWSGPIHLALHGVVDPSAPDRSGLLFSADSMGRDAGMLHEGEIARLPVRSPLVFLSACESGSGRLLADEGTVSLARAFLIAGAKSVVATQWRVDDRASADLVGEFYRILTRDQMPVSALASAQRWMLASDRPLYRHPYFWSPYTIIATSSWR